MEAIKKTVASRMKDKLRPYKVINNFVSKHPKYANNRVLAAIDRWSFRHSPEGKRFFQS